MYNDFSPVLKIFWCIHNFSDVYPAMFQSLEWTKPGFQFTHYNLTSQEAIDLRFAHAVLLSARSKIETYGILLCMLELWSFKFIKLDVCGSLVFSNSVTHSSFLRNNYIDRENKLQALTKIVNA